MDLAEAIRKLSQEYDGKVVTPEMQLTINSLSRSIAEIQKNIPKK
jgi:hypothetical protein